jgi:RimJ/RimL family protein N-acetyltransferase
MTPLGRPISLATERFILRSHVLADVSDRWCGWAGDPDIMGPLNAIPRRSSREQLAKYVAKQDNEHTYLVGIFSKAMGQHIGFYQIDVNKLHRSTGFNVIIGDKQYWGKNAVNETRAALLTEFFERRGVEKAWGQPLARNFPMIFNYKQQGWRLEGIFRGQCLSVTDGSRLDQYQFGMLRDEWRALTNAGAKP